MSMSLGFMGSASGFSDASLEDISSVSVGLKNTPNKFREIDELRPHGGPAIGYGRAMRMAAAPDRDEWLADKTSTFARIVSADERAGK